MQTCKIINPIHQMLLKYDDVIKSFELIKNEIVKTPLLPSKISDGLYYKCESFQICGSFKYRGAISALINYKVNEPLIWSYIKDSGVICCSSGNFGKSMAYVAKKFDINISVILHEYASKEKINQIKQINYKTNLIMTPLDIWEKIMVSDVYTKSQSFYISGESNTFVSRGIATIALEILAFNDFDSIIIPYGGGNLLFSVASVLKMSNPKIKIYAAEINTGAPFSASLKAGKPTRVQYSPSFVDGIGSGFVIPQQFYRIKNLVEDSFVVSLQDVKKAIGIVSRKDQIFAEPAGLVSVAAYLKYGKFMRAELGKCCCIISGALT